jgi:hypothetical protein
MPHSRECRGTGIIVESRSFSALKKFSEFSVADLRARSHANSTSTLRVFSFIVGFVKVDRLDLALSRRMFPGPCYQETAAAASRPALRPDAYFFCCLFLDGNGRADDQKRSQRLSACRPRTPIGATTEEHKPADTTEDHELAHTTELIGTISDKNRGRRLIETFFSLSSRAAR